MRKKLVDFLSPFSGCLESQPAFCFSKQEGSILLYRFELAA
jgi:hypothetical protein